MTTLPVTYEEAIQAERGRARGRLAEIHQACEDRVRPHAQALDAAITAANTRLAEATAAAQQEYYQAVTDAQRAYYHQRDDAYAELDRLAGLEFTEHRARLDKIRQAEREGALGHAGHSGG